MKKCQPSSKAMIVYRFRIVTVLTVLFFIFGVVYVFFRWIALLAAAISLLAAGFLGLLYFPRALQNREIMMDEERVIVRSGVFTRQILIMPLKRLVCVETVASPLAKKYALLSLRINAARCKIVFPFLAEEDGKVMAGLISEKRQGQA